MTIYLYVCVYIYVTQPYDCVNMYTGVPTYHLASVCDDSAKYTCVHICHSAMRTHLYTV